MKLPKKSLILDIEVCEISWIATSVKVTTNAIIALIVILIMNQIISKGISTSIEDFKEYLESFFKFLSRESKDVNDLVIHSNDEIALMAKQVEKNITIIQQTISQDRELIDEAEVVLARACNGWFSQR